MGVVRHLLGDEAWQVGVATLRRDRRLQLAWQRLARLTRGLKGARSNDEARAARDHGRESQHGQDIRCAGRGGVLAGEEGGILRVGVRRGNRCSRGVMWRTMCRPASEPAMVPGAMNGGWGPGLQCSESGGGGC